MPIHSPSPLHPASREIQFVLSDLKNIFLGQRYDQLIFLLLKREEKPAQGTVLMANFHIEDYSNLKNF